MRILAHVFALSLFPVLMLAADILKPPGVVIDHVLAETGTYVGSPSILILPDGNYVASHDFFGPKSTEHQSAVTRIFYSSDRGASWKQVAEVQDQFWSNLFVHRGSVYLMGTTYEYGRIVVRQSKDGIHWSDAHYLSEDTGYHTAPVPMAFYKGRIWRAMEFHPKGPWGFFEAFVISAKEDADLLNPNSWTKTERLPFPKGTVEGNTWLEGNAIVGPHRKLFDVLRVDNLEKAAMLSVDPKKGKLSFAKLVDFPGGAKKFTIRYDRKTRRYWTLSNIALPEYLNATTRPAAVRNTLVLMSSKDLEHWTVHRTVLSHPDVKFHAFQYVDWQFDGNDLAVASRTAFDDEGGGARRGHDANFLTFHRVDNFRKN